MFKKFLICTALSLSLLLCLVSADENTDNGFIEINADPNSTAYQDSSPLTPDEEEAIRSLLENALINREDYVDLSDFNLQYNAITSHIISIFRDILYDNPELFYAVISPQFKVTDSIIEHVKILYACSADELEERRKSFNKEVNKALAVVNDNMTDFEKALAIHDYLVLTAEYNSAATEHKDGVVNQIEYQSAWSAYGVLVDKTGVCMSYALAYKYILNLVGVECEYAIINQDHVWNIVKLNGKWYHVDVTWDDPNAFGKAEHTYFLLSDNAISSGKNPHGEWVAPYVCTDTDYDTAFFRNMTEPIAVASGKLYYIDDVYVVEYDEATGNKKHIYEMDDGSIWYLFPPFETTLYLYKNRLYFNTDKQIISMNTDGSDAQAIYTCSADNYIYRLVGSGSDIAMNIGPYFYKSERHQLSLGEINANYSKADNTVTAHISYYKPVTGQLILSVYSDNNLLSYSRIYSAEDIPEIKLPDADISCIRLMWWDIETLKPYSDSIKIEI